MAYNLQTLITLLEQILNPEQTRWILDDHGEPQLRSLLQIAAYLQQILEKSSIPKIESLESQIREAAHKGEDIIESHMVDQMVSSYTFPSPDLQQVVQQLDFVTEQVKLTVGKKISTASSLSDASSSHDLSSKRIVVGVDGDLMELKDRLIGMQRKLEIIPIIGMGGIGKTTLALKLYQDPLVISYFGSRAWTTISQNHNVRAILLGLLRCITVKEVDDDIELDNLYKSLYGRRYMIVLDDIWSTQAWDDIKRYFPDNNNGSRIVITTRESNVARYADSQSLQHQVQLLSKSASWNLLGQIVFGEEDNCPDELREIGEKIASDCGGLPLAVNVIGGLLSKVERSKDVWENIGNDVRAAIVGSNEQFSNILSLSYDHLPNHLKPCFLYIGAFPEDYEIKASRLVQLWVAEGFVKSNEHNNKSLEEEAEDYLKALVERNVVSVSEKKFGGEAKSYNVHDLLRDVCIRKADAEKFLHVKNSPMVTFSNQRRVSAHIFYGLEEGWAVAELMSLARSFLSMINLSLHAPEILSNVFSALRLLRVLDIMETMLEYFPREIFKLVNLRYLAFSCRSYLPRGISRLQNLQTFIAFVLRPILMPSEIWEMSELRHIKLNGVINVKDECMRAFFQMKLQTISTMSLPASLEWNSFFERIPNIKELGIFCNTLPSSALVDLSHLHKLETLRCTSKFYGHGWCFLPMLRFPPNLRKLTLSDSVIFPAVLATLCALPKLEVLSIRSCVFEGKEGCEVWEAREGDEFRSLQFLRLVGLLLVRWRVDQTNFPRLRHLLMQNCYALEEIPIGIGEIPTLELIELKGCGHYVVESAKQIVEVQQSEYGNYDLQLRVI